MWRTRAVISLLLDDVAAPHVGRRRRDQSTSARHADLEAARRRCRLLAALDWLAIVVLLGLRWGDAPILPVGRTEEMVVTLGVLALAVHSGFLLGLLEKYAAVNRALEELAERSGEEIDDPGALEEPEGTDGSGR